MFNVWIYSLISVFVVSLIAFVGIVTFPIKHPRKLANFLMFMVSFSVGAFLGDVFIHLLPQTVEEIGFTVEVSSYILLGLIFSFIIEKVIHWHHAHAKTNRHYHPSAIMSLIGDAIHNFVDGTIIATSYLISLPVGIATTVAVIFHEIPQEVGNFGVLLYGGFSKNKALFFNFMTVLTAVVGAIIALIIQTNVESAINFFIPFTAGHFIYIAGSDLIPELHKEVDFKKRTAQFIFLLLGIGVMAALILLK